MEGTSEGVSEKGRGREMGRGGEGRGERGEMGKWRGRRGGEFLTFRSCHCLPVLHSSLCFFQSRVLTTIYGILYAMLANPFES